MFDRRTLSLKVREAHGDYLWIVYLDPLLALFITYTTERVYTPFTLTFRDVYDVYFSFQSDFIRYVRT